MSDVGRPAASWRTGLRTWAVVACALAQGLAQAQVLLQPVVLELSPRQRTVVVHVTLSERAAAPVRLQAELLRWSQDAQGRAVTEPADELLVSPPIAQILPGQRQVFRVALRSSQPLAQEAAYRLVLEDVAVPPQDDSGKPSAGIHLRMRYDLPVMVGPAAKPVQAALWKTCAPPSTQEACVALRNTGNRRMKVQALQLAGDGWQRAVPLKEAAIVLAGSQREWRVPLPGAQERTLREVQVQTAGGGTIQAERGAF